MGSTLMSFPFVFHHIVSQITHLIAFLTLCNISVRLVAPLSPAPPCPALSFPSWLEFGKSPVVRGADQSTLSFLLSLFGRRIIWMWINYLSFLHSPFLLPKALNLKRCWLWLSHHGNVVRWLKVGHEKSFCQLDHLQQSFPFQHLLKGGRTLHGNPQKYLSQIKTKLLPTRESLVISYL